MKMLEVACFTVEDAKLALESGADRIEFCADYVSGGITPDLDEFILLRSQFPAAQMHVMIRPREGDFVYSDFKIETMKVQIAQFESAGANGFVFGVLNADDTLNILDCKALIESVKNKASQIVFHRAFDLVPEPELALEQLIELGFTGVLTSGQSKNAADGLEKLKTLVAQAKGRMEIIVGGGVRSHNIESLFETGAKWFHSAAWDLGNKRFNPEELERILNKRATTANM
jgi:copper homeostasis protein